MNFKKIETDSENALRGLGEGIVTEFGIERYRLLYLKWITNKVLLDRTGNSAQGYVAGWTGGELGGEWIHVYIPLSHSAVQEKPSQQC